MYIARQISTNEYIKDFQDRATVESLYLYAEKIGIPRNDVEILDVTPEQYKTIVDTVTAAERAALEQEYELTQTELRAIGQAAATKIGLTKEQMKKFVLFVRQIDIDTI